MAVMTMELHSSSGSALGGDDDLFVVSLLSI